MYYQGFVVEGIASTTVLDAGLVSTVGEPKRIEAVLIDVDAYQGNTIEGWIGTKRVLEISEYVFNTHEVTAVDIHPVSSTKIVRLPVGLDIPSGQIFKIGVNSGLNESGIAGGYEYSIIS